MSLAQEVVAPGAKMMRAYAEKLLKDVHPHQFATKPSSAGKLLEVNHPAFIYGHLALYPNRMLGFMGLSAKSLSLPENFASLFAAGVACQDDPNSSVYPAMQVITSAYFEGYDTVIDALSSLSDPTFRAPHPDEKARERFGTFGATLTFLLGAHVATHLGQMSAWRRCMGHGPV